MNTTAAMDETGNTEISNPGLELAAIRQQKGYSVEYVANKLHLRVRIIELIESGDFNLLPQPVFVKGYLRAYSKLLGVSAEPLLAVFNEMHPYEKKPERTLWQSKKETHKAEHFIRWFTILFAVGVMVAVGIWWQKNKDVQMSYSSKEQASEIASTQGTSELKLTDLSKMQSLLVPTNPQMSPMEKQGG
ncbi:helix-turn-helix domain-containing protein [Legionella waltersii]|uniref:DNA-binding protein n=1 Tax=Legionella waltersii TaxID=66969 RepID=A0A0W1A112_9GAMM|nr:helix-turn-helix domain-containing protein [Legionella waltersii]KTD75052.1 DNA-binding protein [Legionella waltersii]SNV05362.1 DNA-binding protein [Legionella waltersii]